MPEQFDVIVFGSGFGGTMLATLLSRGGMTVAVVDRDRHPRFAIGESSTPIADRILERLAHRYHIDEWKPLARFGSWRETYPDVACGCKRGFSYFWHGAPNGFRATYDHRHELLVAASAKRSVADTQWYRPDVDHLLAKIARRYNVTYFEGFQVVGVEHRDAHDWEVIAEANGRSSRFRAALLVDASGPAGVLMQRMSTEDHSATLQTESMATYGHWRNVTPIQDWLRRQHVVTDDFPYPCRDSVIHHLFRNGWIWQIPFEHGVTSLGFVSAGQKGFAPELAAEACWAECRRRAPVLNEILGEACLAEFPGRIMRSGRLQRLLSPASGIDWAALPFTVGFVDPLHSTGIAQTLHAVSRLATIFLETSPPGRDIALRTYGHDLFNEFLHVDRLISGCYLALDDFQLFTAYSMLYFAAATSMERKLLASPDATPGFLLAYDDRFVCLTRELSDALQAVERPSSGYAPDSVAELCDRVREAVRPYNHVGLFEPELPNMYRYTAAEK